MQFPIGMKRVKVMILKLPKPFCPHSCWALCSANQPWYTDICHDAREDYVVLEHMVPLQPSSLHPVVQMLCRASQLLTASKAVRDAASAASVSSAVACRQWRMSRASNFARQIELDPVYKECMLEDAREILDNREAALEMAPVHDEHRYAGKKDPYLLSIAPWKMRASALKEVASKVGKSTSLVMEMNRIEHLAAALAAEHLHA